MLSFNLLQMVIGFFSKLECYVRSVNFAKILSPSLKNPEIDMQKIFIEDLIMQSKTNNCKLETELLLKNFKVVEVKRPMSVSPFKRCNYFQYFCLFPNVNSV